ncbi:MULTISPECIES: InlB B-repeat-containing protein [unclassified Collinsella]|uniref:InlB B-repeat-containing protein n=1 Tax=unclassified Collinsella TaxID=2637548 RepID=UPI00319E4A20
MKMNKPRLAVGCGRVAAAVVAAGLAASLGVLAPSVAVADEAAATTLEATTQQDPATQAADEPEADTDVVATAPVAPATEDAADDQPAAGAETPVANPVAMIDKTGYATLDGALAAAKDGDVIELKRDAETEKGFGINGIALTVNGNGHVITANKRGVYVLKDGKPASLTFNDVKLNMAPVEGTAVAAGNEANWAAVILNYGCELVFNNSTVTLSPAGNLNTAVHFHSGRLTLNNSKMSVKGFSINGFCTDSASTTTYTTEINVLGDSELEVSGNGRGITSAIQVTVDGSRLTNSKNRGNGSNGADYIVRNGSVADVSSNGSHGMSARNVTIAGSSTVTCNDNGYAGVHFTGNLDIDGTSSLTVDRNARKGGGGLRAMSPSARGHVAKGAVVEVCDNQRNGLENKGTFTFDEGSKLTIMGNHETGNGGGVYNYATGTLTLPSDARIYNNHADKSGDDICSMGSISFGATGADWVLDDCNHAIDGWYVDAADARWSAHGETKHVVLTQQRGTIKGAIALKAAHGLVNVDYKFVGDAPEGAKVPDADADLELGAAYAAKASESVDGYTFDGWYTDEACTAKWNDGDALPGSMTLYGKWTKNPAAPTTPDAGNKTPDKKLPQTGDTTSAALPALLAGGSLAALGAGIALRHREH